VVKPKLMVLSSCLTGRSLGPTLGYTRNAGQRGRDFVDLRRERRWLEWALVSHPTTAS
jgi:hypothetical protein